MGHEVIISYSSFDKLKADAICNRLESKGVRCWIAPRDVPVGSEYADSIVQALEQAQVLVLVYSSHADKSKQVKREVERAVSNGTTIMPVRIEDVEMSNAFEYYVGSIHWLDAIAPPFEDHIDKLADDLLALISKDGRAQTNGKQNTPVPLPESQNVSAKPPPISADVSPAAPDISASKATTASSTKPPESGRRSGMTTAAVIALVAVGAAAGYLYTVSNEGDPMAVDTSESEPSSNPTNAAAQSTAPSNTAGQSTAPTDVQVAEPSSATQVTYQSLVEICDQQVQLGNWGWSCDVPAITTIHPFVSGNCECRGRILLHIETNLVRCEELPSTCGGVSFEETLGYEPDMNWYADISPE